MKRFQYGGLLEQAESDEVTRKNGANAHLRNLTGIRILKPYNVKVGIKIGITYDYLIYLTVNQLWLAICLK